MKFNAFAAACAAVLLTVTPNFCSEADAGPGSGIRLWHDTTLSPLIEGSYTYDSNPLLLPEGEEEDDYFWDLVGALSLIKQNDKQSLSLRAWYQIRRYDVFINLDDDTWQENIDWVYGDTRDLQIILSQRYGVLSDYEFTQSDTDAKNQSGAALLRLIETRTRRVSRFLGDIGAGVSHETDRTEIDGGVSYAAVEFEEEEDLFDWSELQGTIDFGYRATDKTTLALNGVFGQHTTDNSLDKTGWMKGRLGFRTIPTYKTTVSLGAGIESYSADVDETGGSGARNVDLDTTASDDTDLDRTAFHYDGRAVWAATEKIDFQLFGRNEILPTSAFTANTKEVNQGSVGLVYRPRNNLQGTLGLSYRTDDYTRLIGGIDAFEELIGAQLRIVYDNKRRWLQIYGKARYEEFTSNIQDDYVQLRITLGLNLKY
ncbi:outer membrane beta-barrel protein [Verrucomicrobiota bacterium]